MKSSHLVELAREIADSDGFSVDLAWFNSLALHTQVVVKKSPLNWNHGALLYCLVRRYLRSSHDFPIILETGTARGFSAVCMSKALGDHGRQGMIFTLDVIGHQRPRYWNCIDDFQFMKSRKQLLEPWSDETARICFLRGESKKVLGNLHVDRVNFAFLDAQHDRDSVEDELNFVTGRQRAGDVIVLDDVQSNEYGGVSEMLNELKRQGTYSVELCALGGSRFAAVCVRRP